MRGSFKTARHINRNIRRGMRRSFRRRGNLLGLVGIAALGYTLYEKHQREQQRNDAEPFINWNEEISPKG